MTRRRSKRHTAIGLLEWWGCDGCIYAAAKHDPHVDVPCQRCDDVLESTIFVVGTARIYHTPAPLIRHEGKWPIVLMNADTEGCEV